MNVQSFFSFYFLIKDVTDKPIAEDSNLDAAGFTSITHTTQAVTQMAPRNGEQTVKGWSIKIKFLTK